MAIFGLYSIHSLDLALIATSFTGLAVGLSMYRSRSGSLQPAARDTVFETMRDAVLVLDIQRQIIEMNPAARALFGGAASDALGKTLAEIMPDQRVLFDQLGDAADVLTDLRTAISGTPYVFDLRISPVFDQYRKHTGTVVTLRDISEIEEARQQLAEAHEAAVEAVQDRARIVSVISHDLRTPIAAIQGYTDLLKEELDGISPKGVAMAAKVRSASVTLLEMVTNLVDQARLESGSITLNNAPFAPTQLLDMVENHLRLKIESAGLTFARREESDAPTIVTGDVNRLAQTVKNLAEYAIKLTSQGSINVRIYGHDEAHWGIDVVDTGSGLPAEDQQGISDVLAQAKGPGAKHHDLALGLSVAVQMTVRMGGQFALSSQEGQGTTFSLILPISPAA